MADIKPLRIIAIKTVILKQRKKTIIKHLLKINKYVWAYKKVMFSIPIKVHSDFQLYGFRDNLYCLFTDPAFCQKKEWLLGLNLIFFGVYIFIV